MCKDSKLGDYIRSVRLGQSKTQSSMSKFCSVSKPYLVDIEHNRRTPSDKVLKLIAEYLEVDYEHLLYLRSKSRGYVSFNLENCPPFKEELILRFASLYDRITEQDAKEIIKILKD